MDFAHVKWFVETTGGSPSGAELSGSELGLALLAVGLGLYVLRWLHQQIEAAGLNRLTAARLWPLVPTIVRVSTGALLLLNSFNGHVIAPNFTPTSGLAQGLSIGFVAIGLALLIGAFTRLAAGLLLAGYLAAFAQFGLVDLLDHLEYVGLSLYIMTAGAGPWSVDRAFGLDPKPTDARQTSAARQLQIWTGLAVVVLALSEKILAVGLAGQFLQVHDWNFLSPFSIGNRTFIVAAGTMELLVGLSFILGWAMRLTTLALLSLMTVTAVLLGLQEIIGHLFAVALVASVWITRPATAKLSAKVRRQKAPAH